jgi:hypothetical protein
MKSNYYLGSSLVLFIVTIPLAYIGLNGENSTSSPTVIEVLSLCIFPIISIILSVLSRKHIGSKGKILSTIIIILSLVLLSLFLLIARSHCGFYTGKCR